MATCGLKYLSESYSAVIPFPLPVYFCRRTNERLEQSSTTHSRFNAEQTHTGAHIDLERERERGLTWIEVFDVGLSLSLQLLPSDGICLLHLELHLTKKTRAIGGEKEEEEEVGED